MNLIKSSISLAAALASFSIAIAGDAYVVDPTGSEITWKGTKVGGAHMGVVSLKSGSLIFSDSGLTGGSFEIDMTSIDTTDLTGGKKKRLDKHLMSKDFFAINLFPSATVEITNVAAASGTGAYEVTADLSVKGISKQIQFTAYVDQDGDSATAKADILFDRSKYDVTYRSGSFFEKLGDKLIHDNVEVGVTLALNRDS